MFNVTLASNGSSLKLQRSDASGNDETIAIDVSALVADGNHITALAASPIGGSVLLCGTNRGNVAAWALAAGTPSTKAHGATMEFVGVICAHAYQVRRLRFCMSGERAVSCSDDCTAVVFDLLAGLSEPKRARRLTGHRAVVTDAHFTADRTRVVSAAADGAVLIHLCGDASVIGRLSLNAPLVSVALSADETLVYACSRNAVMRADLASLYRPAVDRNCSTSTQGQFVVAIPGASSSSQTPAISLPIDEGSAAATGPFVAVALSDDGCDIVALGQRGAALRWRTAERIIDDGHLCAEEDAALSNLQPNTLLIAARLAAPRASAEGVLHVPTLGWASWHAPAVAPTVAPLGAAQQRFAAAVLAGIEMPDPAAAIDDEQQTPLAGADSSSTSKRKRDSADVRLEELHEKQRRLQSVCDKLFVQLKELEAAAGGID